MGNVHLVGGGWSDPSLFGPFVAAAGGSIACVILDEGDGAAQFERYSAALGAAGDCRPLPVLVPVGSTLNPAVVTCADALFVAGGLTPAYAAAMVPVAAELRDWLGHRPYCGFSAGSAIAGVRAVVGGWTVQGRPLIPEDAAEDLEEVVVLDGLGLVPFLVDVHAGQWGTLPRLIESVMAQGRPGLAIDEDTAVTVGADGRLVSSGRGFVHVVRPSGTGSVEVQRYAAGAAVDGFSAFPE